MLFMVVTYGRFGVYATLALIVNALAPTFGGSKDLVAALKVVAYGSTALTLTVLLLPFFVFNWYFHYRVPVLTSIGMLDFAGNVSMLVLAVIGWRAAPAEEVGA